MDYGGVSVGKARIENFTEHGVHAFPDLATAGSEPLSLKFFSDKSSKARKISGGWRKGDLGLELSMADLGKHRMGFDISGEFGTALGRKGPISGSFHEEGTFNILAPAIAATYSKKFGPFEATAKAGLALGLSESNTVSDYVLQEAEKEIERGRVNKHTSHISLAPLISFAAALKIGKDLSAKIEAERYSGIRVGKSSDPAYHDKGKVNVDTLWLGLEKSF